MDPKYIPFILGGAAWFVQLLMLAVAWGVLKTRQENLAEKVKSFEGKQDALALSMQELIRQETKLENYHQRIKKLEEIADGFVRMQSDVGAIKQMVMERKDQLQQEHHRK